MRKRKKRGPKDIDPALLLLNLDPQGWRTGCWQAVEEETLKSECQLQEPGHAREMHLPTDSEAGQSVIQIVILLEDTVSKHPMWC